LAELAGQQHRILQVGHILRFDTAVLWLREAIAAGEFGRLNMLRGYFGGFKRPRNDSGVMFSDGIHFVDLFNFLLGALPKTVLGDGRCITTNKTDYADRLRMLRNHGRQGKYDHEFTGHNVRFNEINASPLHLREGTPEKPSMPVPQDPLDLFRLLADRRAPYLLVGGLAMLSYVNGRNTKDVNLIMSAATVQQIPELVIEDESDYFARAKFRSGQVNLLLTKNRLFKRVEENFATKHRFAELDVPTVTVEGLIVLKLYALPSLYRQFDWDRIYLYESDVKLLLARHKP
jgi:hypothetical protein